MSTENAECRLGQALVGQGRSEEARPLLQSGASGADERAEVDAYRRECLAAL